MKSKLFYVLASIAACLVLSSCGVELHAPGANQDMVLTNVNLSQNNYRIIGDTQGTSTATYVFGMGGLSRRALESCANAEMVKNAHLSGAQAIINKTVDVKVQSYFIVSKRTVTVRGQIIEFR